MTVLRSRAAAMPAKFCRRHATIEHHRNNSLISARHAWYANREEPTSRPRKYEVRNSYSHCKGMITESQTDFSRPSPVSLVCCHVVDDLRTSDPRHRTKYTVNLGTERWAEIALAAKKPMKRSWGNAIHAPCRRWRIVKTGAFLWFAHSIPRCHAPPGLRDENGQ